MDHNLSFSWCWNSLLQFKDNFYFHFFAFYLPLGRYRNSLFRAGVRAGGVRVWHLFDTLPEVRSSRNFQDILVWGIWVSGQYVQFRPTKVKVTKVKFMVNFCVFYILSRTCPRVFIEWSSKLVRMCPMTILKNVGKRNFEFLSQSNFRGVEA